MLCSRRKIVLATKGFLVLWVLVILYLYLHLNMLPGAWSSGSKHTSFLRDMMVTRQNISIHQPLSDLVHENSNSLFFYHLPRRSRDTLFTEVTSANRYTGFPHAPDFTFHIDYQPSQVVLHQDFGVGCIHRLYLFPALPTHTELLYKLTAHDLKDSFIVYEVDGTEYKYSLELFVEGKEWPFIYPFNTRHKYLASGMGFYMPICYQKSVRVIYIPSEPLPPNLLSLTVNCSIQDMICPVHIYSAVSQTKYPIGQRVEVFPGDSKDGGSYQSRVKRLAQILEEPDRHGPEVDKSCRLTCLEMCKGCVRVIHRQQTPGVISAIKIRVFETASGELRRDWMDILFSASFDNVEPAQINKVPLGSLFGATASMNEFGAATFGKRKRKCSYGDYLLGIPTVEITGFFYFPMPFWKGVKLTLEGSEFIDTPLLVCHEVTVDENYYERKEAGYLHAEKTYYGGDVSGYRPLLSVSGAWGQIVGVWMDVDNLHAARNVPVSERWAPLESDPLIYRDGSRAVSVLGTGLEDYFSYAHGFSMAENTTYAFVGNYHATPKQKEPLTWHCYRLHVLDPIYFFHSLEFVMEGMSATSSHLPETQLSYEDYTKKKYSDETCFSHLVLYYKGTRSGLTTTDIFQLSHDISEQEHQLEIVKAQSRATGRPFHLAQKHYLGTSSRNSSYDVSGRRFTAGDKFTFTMRCLETNRGVILRREFYSQPGASWNEEARLWINGKFVGTWFIAMGALSEMYSLRVEDYIIGLDFTENLKLLEISIEVLTAWNDINYRIFNID